MNWDAVGAIAELIGAIGVILSLVYLAAQIRQSTGQMAEHSRALRVSAIDEMAASFSRFRDPLIRDPELADLWLRGTKDWKGLNELDQVRCGRLLQELFFAHQNTWARYLEGAYAEEAWADHKLAIAGNLRLPGIRDWWRETRSIYLDDFEEVVEQLIRELPLDD